MRLDKTLQLKLFPNAAAHDQILWQLQEMSMDAV